jgi:hypothetical protein
MQRLRFSLHLRWRALACTCVMASSLFPAQAMAWWNGAWQHRIKATCGGLNAPAATLNGFPCLITLTTADPPPSGQVYFDYSQARTEGQDLRLIAADDSTQLAYHIETWNGAADNRCTEGCSQIHAKTDVAPTTGTDLYVYYGNPATSDAQDPAGTFSAFTAAWLMNDAGSPIHDYTEHGNDCARAVGTPRYGQTGEVDGGVSWLDAGSDCGAMPALNGTPHFTLATWVKFSTLRNYGFLFDKEPSSAESVALLEGGFVAGDGNNKDLKLATSHRGPAFGLSGDILTTETWLHVAMWYDGTQTGNANRLKLYVNGVEKPLTFTGTIPATLADGLADVLIGRNASGNPLDATLDEYFVATASLSAEFVKALYDSGRGTFVTFGQPETAPTATATPTNTPTSTPTPVPCVGDCGGDQQVTVDDILTTVHIALGDVPVSQCRPGDANHDDHITVDEILAAVNNALNGCAKGAPPRN